MQAKLPDINASIVTHRGNMLSAFSHQSFPKVIISFRAINALMPEEYRLEINSKKYYNELKSNTFFTCLACHKNEIPFTEIVLYDKLNDSMQLLLSKEKYTKHWFCPYCKITNNFKSSDKLLDIPKDPFFIRIIPSPPRIVDTFSRLGHLEDFARWFEIALPELEHQIGLFRTNYIQSHADNEDEMNDVVGDISHE